MLKVIVDLIFNGSDGRTIGFRKPRLLPQLDLANLEVYIQQMNADFIAGYFNPKIAVSPGLDATASKSWSFNFIVQVS